MPFELPQLNYKYSALEPVVDEQTMTIHHTKHHQGYVNKLNAALEGHSDLQEKSIEEILTNLDSVDESIRTAVQNNGGGHYNHSIFWSIMTPGGQEMSNNMRAALENDFGSVEAFNKEFTNAALTRFGSGWAWLVKNNDGSLEVVSTPNQNNPISHGQYPLLGLDVWEHAYYLKYQNKRAEYVQNFFSVIDWNEVENRLTS